MIDVKSLRVDYDDVNAVNDLDIVIEPGQIYGLVGPNGAGKTSTIKTIAGIIEPTYGEIKIDGIDFELEPQKALEKIGYMPDFSPLYENLKVWEYLDVFAAAYLIPKKERNIRINDWINTVDLAEKKDAYIRNLSRGMRQRLVLAKTLLPDPTVLLLDEPASGLDPIARKEISDVLISFASQNKAILISSHILSELSDFCNAIGIMEKGKMVISGSIDKIRDQLGSKGRLFIRLSHENEDMANKLYDYLNSSKFVVNIEKTENKEFCAIFTGNQQDAAWLLSQIVKMDISISDFFIQEEDVQDLFFRIGANKVS